MAEDKLEEDLEIACGKIPRSVLFGKINDVKSPYDYGFGCQLSPGIVPMEDIKAFGRICTLGDGDFTDVALQPGVAPRTLVCLKENNRIIIGIGLYK